MDPIDTRFRADELMTGPSGRPRGRRILLWLLGVPAALCLLLVALGLGAVGYSAHASERRLADAIATADRDDKAWRIGDLLANRVRVPDPENSARVVAEAAARLPERWPSPPGPARGAATSPETALLKADFSLATAAANVRLDDATAGTLRAEMAAHQDGVRLARSLARYRRGRNERVLGPKVLDTPLTGGDEARTVARLLAVDAAARAHDGDLDGALDSCSAMLGVARSFGDEPFGITQLVRTAVGGRAMTSLRRVLGHGEPSDEALARVQAAILDELAEPALLDTMLGERATDDELIRRIGPASCPSRRWAATRPGDPPGTSHPGARPITTRSGPPRSSG